MFTDTANDTALRVPGQLQHEYYGPSLTRSGTAGRRVTNPSAKSAGGTPRLTCRGPGLQRDSDSLSAYTWVCSRY